MAWAAEFTKGWPFEPVRAGERISLTELRLREQAMARAPLFASLPKRDLRSLAEVTSVERYEPGSVVVKEGAAGTAFFVILEGRAKVAIGSRAIASLGPGDFFGEISLLDGDPRTASVVADSSMLCLKLGGTHFLRLLQDQPKLMLKLLREVARRLRAAESPPAG
jgi:CRP/FNR family cyclic AMP-dependent transcriptional regulator